MPQSRRILLRGHALLLYGLCVAIGLVGSEPNDLPVATPESQGVDSRPLEECLRFIRSEGVRIHSLLIVRHGKVVLDAYFYPFQKLQLHDVASVTKSITSAIVGIAVDNGRIKSAREPVLPLLPNIGVSLSDPRKRLITIEDLLTMRSGLDCGYHQGEVELAKMRTSPDWANFALNLPMRGDPGKQFSYCSCNPFLLSAIISARIGESELEFARRHLFSPLGINAVIWPSDPQGRTHGWGDLHLFPNDMAKIGLLFLNAGKWNGRSLISASWVRKSLSTQVQARSGMGYGYAWWINENLHPPGFEAAGRGGQQIAILPAYDAVVVFTGGGFDAGKISPFLFKSLAASDSLPENPGSLRELKRQLKLASEEPNSQRSRETALPQMARYASGRKYVFPANDIQLRSIRLHFPSASQAHAEIDLAGQIFNFDVGLDDRLKMSQGQYGLPIAAKGRWLTADTFSLDLDTVSNINHFVFELKFDRDRLSVRLDELTGEVQGLKVSGQSS